METAGLTPSSGMPNDIHTLPSRLELSLIRAVEVRTEGQ